MPATATTPQQSDTPGGGGYFDNAFMGMQDYFDFVSNDPKSHQERLTPPPTSPVLNRRTTPDLWGNFANSPGSSDFHPFAATIPALSSLDTQKRPCSPGVVAPHQTTTTGANIILGNPSPPNSSESSPQKYAPSGDISPLDTFICGLPESTRTVHGQVTPPSEILQSPNISPLPAPSFSASYNLAQAERSPAATPRNSVSISPREQSVSTEEPLSKPARRQSAGTKRRRSSSEQTGGRKSRKNSTAQSQEPPELQEVKRKRFLERNRVAASKCRQKKKVWMQELEADAREAQSTSKHLKMMVSMLRENVLQLKNELLKHNTCDCTPIRQYLSNAAVKLVNTSSLANTAPLVNTASLGGLTLDDRRASAISECSSLDDLKADDDFDLDLVGSPEDMTA